MTEKRDAVLIGATGLVGRQLLDILLGKDLYGKIYAPSRATLGIEDDRLINPVESFEKLENHQEAFQVQDMFFCFGTTLRKAGSRQEFERIEKGYSYKIFKLAEAGGVRNLFMISAAGANAASMIMYNRIKGEIEQFAYDCSFESVYIFRPGLLLGERTERRLLESIAIGIVKPMAGALNFVTRGRLAVASGSLATKMARVAEAPEDGVHIVSNSALVASGRQ